MYHIKRPREEDEVDWTADHTPKRSKTLPFRSSPTAQHSTLFSATRQLSRPPALTPAESSDEDSEIEFQSPDYLPKPNIPAFVTTDADMDYHMDDGQPMTSPMWSPKTPANGLLGGGMSSGLASPAYPQLLKVGAANHLDVDTARVPTPIYGHFAPLQRTTIANAHSPTAANPPAAGVVRTTNEQHDAFLRRRRLPSPICEDAPLESPSYGNRMNSIDTIVESPLCTDSAMDPAAISMLQGLDMRTTPSSAVFPSQATTGFSMSPPPLPSGSSRRKSSGESLASGNSSSSGGAGGRRRRSDAVSGGESRKFVFSMGFRSDCEKCREHVPGHYSHVLQV